VPWSRHLPPIFRK